MTSRLAAPSAEPSALRECSIPQILLERAASDGAAVAYRAKRLGLYRERRWCDMRDDVATVAAGLHALGLAAGDTLAIIGDACEEWLLADLAAQSLGAISFGIYPTASPSEVAYQLGDAGARIVVCKNQEYVDKVLPALDKLPHLAWLVVVDATAMFAYAHDKLVAWQALCERGRAAPIDLAAAVARVRPEQPAFIVYTSGTTGNPKGALVSHGRHLAAAATLLDCYPELARGAHRTLAYLPLCHVLGRDAAITLPLLSGIVPHFGEDREDLATTLFEVAPTVLFTVPRYLQKFASQILVGIAETAPLKRFVYERAVSVGRAQVKRRWQGEPGVGLAYRLAWHAAFRPILNKLGLDCVRLMISGGAPLAPETMALWHIFGVNVVEIYGQTETAGAIVAGQRGPFPRPGDVGVPPTGWEVRLAESGEILVKSPDLFDGYWRNPAATAEVVDADGWLHTGDVGRWEDGRRLRLVDRARDFIVTAGGKTLSPSHIENTLRSSPYVSEAVVFGHNRKYITALIEIDLDTVAAWARGQGIAYTGFASLAENPKVQTLLREAVDAANTELARVEQVKTFRILPKSLDPEEEGEPVTATRKVKRGQMYERFRDLVESMYGHEEEELIAREVGELLA